MHTARKRVEKPEQSAQERLAAADKKEAEQSAGKVGGVCSISSAALRLEAQNAGAHNSGDEQEEDEADEFDDEEVSN